MAMAMDVERDTDLVMEDVGGGGVAGKSIYGGVDSPVGAAARVAVFGERGGGVGVGVDAGRGDSESESGSGSDSDGGRESESESDEDKGEEADGESGEDSDNSGDSEEGGNEHRAQNSPDVLQQHVKIKEEVLDEEEMYGSVFTAVHAKPSPKKIPPVNARHSQIAQIPPHGNVNINVNANERRRTRSSSRMETSGDESSNQLANEERRRDASSSSPEKMIGGVAYTEKLRQKAIARAKTKTKAGGGRATPLSTRSSASASSSSSASPSRDSPSRSVGYATSTSSATAAATAALFFPDTVIKQEPRDTPSREHSIQPFRHQRPPRHHQPRQHNPTNLDTTTTIKSEFQPPPTHSRQRSKLLDAVLIPPKPQNITFPYSSLQSGYVYDARMRFHTELPLAKWDDDFHPEDPRRILEIYDELMAAGLIWDPANSEQKKPSVEQMWRIGARKARREEICLVHSEVHYEWCRMLSSKPDEILVELGPQLDSVYLHQLTFLAAQIAAGGAIEACKAVVAEKVKNSVAIIRPPGHHAEHARPGGFCFFNNVCVAARVCQRDFPDRCRKVLILDWDVHHGNGVQEAFYADPNVLYISLHVHKGGSFYPTTPYGNHLHCGEGVGLGKNVNIPWETHGMGDGDYMYAFQQLVMPIALEFDPDLVIISAGFDAAEGDMLGQCHVSPAGFAHMTHMLMSLARGKVTACLEGGYNLRSIAKSALAMTRVLMGEPPDRLDEGAEPSPSGVRTVQMVMRQQARFWKCMYPKPIISSGGNAGAGLRESVPSERMHDVVRAWQGKVLWDEYQMLSLFIRRERISKSFENQVLATPNYNDARPLLVIFHDPPEVKGVPDPRTNRLELHNTWLLDATKKYVDWAVKNHFAVIDVNIPRHITDLTDENDYTDSESQDARANATRELATYLWENYIELSDATHLFLLGIGDAYSGLVDLLSRNESCIERVTFIVSFVAENSLQSVRRPADEYVSGWYFDHSLIFVANNHGVWDPDRTRKPRRKYGRLIKSPYDNLNDMLQQHKEEVTKLLFDQIQEWVQEHAEAEMADAGGHAGNDVSSLGRAGTDGYSSGASGREGEGEGRGNSRESGGGSGGGSSGGNSNVASASATESNSNSNSDKDTDKDKHAKPAHSPKPRPLPSKEISHPGLPRSRHNTSPPRSPGSPRPSRTSPRSLRASPTAANATPSNRSPLTSPLPRRKATREITPSAPSPGTGTGIDGIIAKAASAAVATTSSAVSKIAELTGSAAVAARGDWDADDGGDEDTVGGGKIPGSVGMAEGGNASEGVGADGGRGFNFRDGSTWNEYLPIRVDHDVQTNAGADGTAGTAGIAAVNASMNSAMEVEEEA